MSERHDYAEDKADADELIAEFGQEGKVLKYTKTGSDYNPTITFPEHDCIFAVLEYENREVDGTRVLVTDKKVLLAKGDLSFDPSKDDKLKIGGVDHTIIRSDPFAPGGTTLFIWLQCRR